MKKDKMLKNLMTLLFEPDLNPKQTGQFIHVKSEDDGLIWSDPISITHQIKNPNWNLFFNSPGKGEPSCHRWPLQHFGESQFGMVWPHRKSWRNCWMNALLWDFIQALYFGLKIAGIGRSNFSKTNQNLGNIFLWSC